jgi:aminopeptidase
MGSLSGYLNADSSYSFLGDKSNVHVSLAGKNDLKSWKEGIVNASAQNLARSLTEMPANKLTPIEFCKVATELLREYSNVSIHEYDKEWIASQNMGLFLSVTNGSDEPCRFLELKYFGNPKSSETSVLVGKGVTFDAGGISIKPSTDMALMKGDMGGAAVTLAAFKAAVELDIPINLIALIPLTENLINGKATKPGDVFTASNGKTIEVDNTDAEGRLLLADAIYYGAKTYNPNCIVELSTLTGAMDIALGYHFAGTFTNSDRLWSLLDEASQSTDDLLWRMPLEKVYLDQMRSNVADYKNVGGRSGGSCTAAAFLEEFASFSDNQKNVTKIPFAHIDIAGVFHKRSGKDFLANGMTGMKRIN